MFQKPRVMNPSTMTSASCEAHNMVESLRKTVHDIETDARKPQRMEKHECKNCFYNLAGRMGGTTGVTRPCMSCDKEVYYCSTATDVLCLECAKKHSLCKHCGGDLAMRFKRRNWPKPDKETGEL